MGDKLREREREYIKQNSQRSRHLVKCTNLYYVRACVSTVLLNDRSGNAA